MLSWKHTIQILMFILVLGGAFRFFALGQNSFVADEFLDINSAYGYHQTGKWQAWDFNVGAPSRVNENAPRDERAVLYKWQVAQLFAFLPPTEITARTMSVLWGIFAVLVVFWSAWIFTQRRDTSLVAALLCALSVSAIIFSRRLRMYAMFFPLYLASATAWYAFYEREYGGRMHAFRTTWERYGINLPYLVPAVLCLALSLAVHQLAPHLIIVLGVYLCLSALMLWRRGERWQNKYAVSAALGIAAALAVVLFAPKFVRGFTAGLVFFDDHVSYIGYVFADFATPVIGLVLSLAGGVFLWRWFGRPQAALYLGLSLGVPLFMAIFLWRRNAGPQYIFFIQSFVMLLSAVGVVGVFEFLRQSMGEQWSVRKGILVGIGLLVLVPNLGYFLEENNTYHETSTGGNPNYRKVFAYFKKEKITDDVLITRNFRNYYWSGANVPVYDFGGELARAKLSLADIQNIERDHPSGWFIYSGNDEDYIASEVERYAEKHWERVSNANVRGDITVFRWGAEE